MFIAIPFRVFISETQSAPPASTAFAIATMSVTLGESFTIIGRRVEDLTFRVIVKASSGSAPNAMPPLQTLGQEIFTSMPSDAFRPVQDGGYLHHTRRPVSPRIFTMILVSISLKYGSFSERNCFSPTFCRPIALSIPPAVSIIRGGGFPIIGSSDIPFTTIAPSLFRSTYDSKFPAVAECARGCHDRVF